MSLTRWDPLREMRSLTRRVEQALDPATAGLAGTTFDPWSTWSAGPGAFPTADLYEDREEIIIRAEMPGMEQKDVEVLLEDSTLTLRGEHKLKREDHKENYVRIESAVGSFSRSFSLPSTIDRDKISADMKNGVLEVHIPKREGAKAKAIPIRS